MVFGLFFIKVFIITVYEIAMESMSWTNDQLIFAIKVLIINENTHTILLEQMQMSDLYLN